MWLLKGNLRLSGQLLYSVVFWPKTSRNKNPDRWGVEGEDQRWEIKKIKAIAIWSCITCLASWLRATTPYIVSA